jgi:hypothetical protein
MIRTLALVVAMAASAAPLAAQDDSYPVLERRARACLSNGAAGAPRDSLLSAVVALRSLCAPQITRLRAARLAEVDAGFPPDRNLTATQRDARERARDTARRQLNDEIALAISNFTGLNP